jgi:multidrug resistance efflux pump
MKSQFTPNNSDSTHQRPTLQVVPPTALKPTPPPETKPTQLPTTSTPEIIPHVTTKSSNFFLLRPLLMIGVIVGVGALGFMRVSSSVNGNTEVTSSEKARQTVTMQIAGRLELTVSSGQVVKNQLLGLIKSEEVNKDIAESTRISDQFQMDADLSQSQVNNAKSTLNQALARLKTSQQKTADLQRQLNQGNSLPQIQDLQNQQDSIESEIAGLKSNLKLIVKKLERYQEVIESGGIGVIPRNQIESEEQQRNSLSQQIQGKQYQIKSQANRIEAFKQNLQQDLSQKQAEESQDIEAVKSAEQQFKNAEDNVLIKQKVANKRADELNKVQNRKQDLELRAPISGTIITQDLYKKNNQFAALGSPVLEIVDVNKPRLEVKVKPEDIAFVREGQTVRFRPQGRGLLSYTGTVEKISPQATSDGIQHPPMFTVYVTLNQTDNSLLQGLTGDAHIEVDSVLLYQKIQREFERLVPVGKFF